MNKALLSFAHCSCVCSCREAVLREEWIRAKYERQEFVAGARASLEYLSGIIQLPHHTSRNVVFSCAVWCIFREIR